MCGKGNGFLGWCTLRGTFIHAFPTFRSDPKILKFHDAVMTGSWRGHEKNPWISTWRGHVVVMTRSWAIFSKSYHIMADLDALCSTSYFPRTTDRWEYFSDSDGVFKIFSTHTFQFAHSFEAIFSLIISWRGHDVVMTRSYDSYLHFQNLII